MPKYSPPKVRLVHMDNREDLSVVVMHLTGGIGGTKKNPTGDLVMLVKKEGRILTLTEDDMAGLYTALHPIFKDAPMEDTQDDD